jgi:hypothetical protein
MISSRRPNAAIKAHEAAARTECAQGTIYLQSRWEDSRPMEGQMEEKMPIILWLLGVPLVVVVALMLTHVI